MQLSVHLQAFAGVYFARNFHKATRNADSSLDCPASIFSLPPSADCVLLWTAISTRLFSSVLLCQLLSLSSLGPSSPPPLPVSREISPSGPLCGFHAKADKEILWPAHTHTNTTNSQHSVIIGNIILMQNPSGFNQWYVNSWWLFSFNSYCVRRICNFHLCSFQRSCLRRWLRRCDWKCIGQKKIARCSWSRCLFYHWHW